MSPVNGRVSQVPQELRRAGVLEWLTTATSGQPCSRSVFSKALSRARTATPTPFCWPICLLYPALIGHHAFIRSSNHSAFTYYFWFHHDPMKCQQTGRSLWSWNDIKPYTAGTSLMVQQLRLLAPRPGMERGTHMPQLNIPHTATKVEDPKRHN